MITCHFCREGASVGIISGPNRRGPPNTRVHTGGLFISMHCRTAAITSMVYIPKCNIKIFRCLYKRSYNESLGTEPFVRRPPSLRFTLGPWRYPPGLALPGAPHTGELSSARVLRQSHVKLTAAPAAGRSSCTHRRGCGTGRGHLPCWTWEDQRRWDR